MNPIDNEDLYNSVIIDGRRSPGTVSFDGHERRDRWEKKSAPGQDGAGMTRNGDDPTEFTATFYLATPQEWEEWTGYRKIIDDTVEGSAVKAKDIYHPDLADNGIKSIVRASIAGAKNDGKGGRIVAVRLLEYRPPKKKPVAGATPSGATRYSREIVWDNGKNVRRQDPKKAGDDELERLRRQYEETPWG